MKKILLLVSVLLLFLVGCEEKDVQPEENNAIDETEIVAMQTQIVELQNQLAELKTVTEFQYNQNNYTFNQLLLTDEQVEHIIKHLPNVERKFGYIEEIHHTEIETTLRVQLVDMKGDDSMPNNYRLDYLEIANLTVSNDPLMYALEGVEQVKVNSIEELNEKINEHMRLFIFTMIDDKAVMISEQYLP